MQQMHRFCARVTLLYGNVVLGPRRVGLQVLRVWISEKARSRG